MLHIEEPYAAFAMLSFLKAKLTMFDIAKYKRARSSTF